MIKPILQIPADILRDRSRTVKSSETDYINKVSDDLTDTLWASNGLGLSAVQIGEAARICIVRTGNLESRVAQILVNPIITGKNGLVFSAEQCLSIPDLRVSIPRYRSITVETDTGSLSVSGLRAFVIQHEIDHMDGILISDYLDGTNGKYGGKEMSLGKENDNAS